MVLCCLWNLLFHITLCLSWVGEPPFTVLRQCSTDISVLCLSQLPLIHLIIFGFLEAINIRSIRWSRALRPAFLINFPKSRQVNIWFRIRDDLFLQKVSWFLVNKITFCLHRSEGLSQASRTPCPISCCLPLFMFRVLMFSLMALKLFGNQWAHFSRSFCLGILPYLGWTCWWHNLSPNTIFRVQTLQECSWKGKSVSVY